MDQNKEIQNLEEDWNVIQRDEMSLDGRSNKIIMSLVNKFTLFVVMMGLGSVVVLSSSKRTLYLLLGMMAVIFLTGVGFSTFTAFNKFKKMQPLVNEIKTRKLKLKKMVRDMQVQPNKTYGGADLTPSDSMSFARSRVNLMEDTLRIESGGFKEDPTSFFMMICGASFVYLLSVITCISFMHKG